VEAGIISKILDCNQVFVPVYYGILALSRIHHFTRGVGNCFQEGLIVIKYMCQCVMAALCLARFFTLRVVAGSISKMCFAGCIVSLGVIFCLGIMSRAAGYRAVHEAYACAHVFANLQIMDMAHFMQSSLYFFFF
jgi:hypothetical protein